MRQKVKRYSRAAISVLLTLCMLVSCMTVGIIATDAAKVTDDEAVGADDTKYILMSTSDNIESWGESQDVGVAVTKSGSKFTATIPINKFPGGFKTGQNYFLCIANSKNGSDCFFYDENVEVTSSVTGGDFSSNGIQQNGKSKGVRFSMAKTDGITAVVVTVTANSSTHNYALSTTTGTSETKYGVTVAAQTGGSVVAGSTAIAAGNSTTVQVSSSNATTFTATPASGYSFGGWTMTGGVTLTSGTASNTTIKATASAAGTLTATFTKNAVQTRVVYYDNSQTQWETPYAQAYTGTTQYLGVAPGTAMTVFDADNNVWYINVPVDATTIVFSENGSSGCSPQTIPTDYTGPEFYDYTGASGTGAWKKYTSPLLDNEKNATLGSSITGNANLYSNINATFFDYYTDNEVNGSWYSSIDGFKDGWIKTDTHDTGYWDQITRNPYTTLNKALSKYAADNSVARPMYFGAFYYDSAYHNPGYTNSEADKNGHKINDSNQLTNGNTAALPGLAGKTISNGEIYYYGTGTNENGASMALFDKQWLAGTGSDDDANKLKLVYSDSFKWSDASANVYVIFRNNWPNEYCVEMTNDSINKCFTAEIPSGWENSKVCFVRMASGTTLTTGSINNVTTAQANWNKINGSNCWNKTDTGMTRSGNVFTLTSWTGGDWSTDYNGPLASIVNTQFPVRKGSKDGITYYEFNSTGATDNIYFNNLTGNDTTIEYGAGETYGQKSGYNSGYGFFPFDKYTDQKISGQDATKSYGKDLAFGMKLDVKFTVGEGGKINNVAQKFDFSGDDDLWVYIDDQLVLDMGGDHAKATGYIDFSTKNVSVTAQDTTLSSDRNGNFDWFDNNDTSKVHTMTLYYVERGMHESNLKFGFSFTPVSNQFVATESLSTDGVNAGLQEDVVAAEANDKITVTHATAKNVDENNPDQATYTAAANKDYTLLSGTTSTKKNTGSGGTYDLGNGDVATFVGKFDDGIGADEQGTPQPDYFKLTTSSAANNVFKYNTVLTSVTDLVMEQYVQQLGTDNNIFKFRSLKNPKNSLDATDIQADFVSTISTKSMLISKSILGYSDSDNDFTVHVQVDIDGTGTRYGYKDYALTYLKDGTEYTMTNGTFTLKQDEVAIIQGIPEGAKVKISEENVANLENPHYQHLSTEVLDNDGDSVASASSGQTAEFTLTEDVHAEITNKPRLQDITVTKQTDVDDYDTAFQIKIETSSDNSTWTAKTGTLYGNDHENEPIDRTDTDGFYTVHKGDTLFIRDIPEDNYVRVTESKPTATKYDFSKSAVTVPGRTATTGSLSETTYKQNKTSTQVQGWYQVKASNNNVVVVNRTKTQDVTIEKVISNSDNTNQNFPIHVKVKPNGATDSITQSYTYQIGNAAAVTVDNASATDGLALNIQQGTDIQIQNIPVGAEVIVSEDDISGLNYNYVDITSTDANGTHNATNQSYTFTVVENTDPTVTINNAIKTRSVTIGKRAAEATSSDKFKLKVEVTQTKGTFTLSGFDADGKKEFTAGSTSDVTLNVPADAKVKVTEENSDIATGFEFWKISLNNTDQTVTNNSYEYQGDAATTTAQIILVHNRKLNDLQLKKKTDAPYDYTTNFKVRIQKKVGDVYQDLYSGGPDTTYKSLNGTSHDNNTINREAKPHYNNSNVDYYYYELKKDDVLTIPGISPDAELKIFEVDLDTTYYTYNANQTQTENASLTGYTAVDNGFTFKASQATAVLYNSAVKHDVTVKKTTDFDINDGSEFTVHVSTHAYGRNAYADDATGVVYNANNEPVNDNNLGSGNYKLQKNWYIKFENVTHGSMFIVSEADYGESDVTKERRFTLQYISDGDKTITENSSNKSFTIVDNTELDVHNIIFKNDITIKKIVQRVVGQSKDETTTHKIKIDLLRNGKNSEGYKSTDVVTLTSSINSGTQQYTSFPIEYDIKEDETITLSGIYAGTFVTIEEEEVGDNYHYQAFKKVENVADYKEADGVKYASVPKPSIDDEHHRLTFQTKNLTPGLSANIEIENVFESAKTITLNKLIEDTFHTTVTDTESEFNVLVEVSSDNTTFEPITGSYTKSGTAVNFIDGNATLKGGETVTFSVDANKYIRVTESSTMPQPYKFGKITIDGVSGDQLNGWSDKVTDDMTINVTNILDFKYDITYKYESYSAKTYKDSTTLTDANRVEGPERSFKRSENVTAEEMNTYFKRDNNNIVFKNDTARTNFISNHAPYEDDFMLNLHWNGKVEGEVKYSSDTRTIALTTKADVELDRQVNVTFKFHYSVNDNDFNAKSNEYSVDPIIKTLPVQYGNWAKKDGAFVTAPLTLDNGSTKMYFQYWQITSMSKTDENDRNTGVETQHKKCYYADFNMTMYQDSYVEPIYKAEETTYNPSATSMVATKNGATQITFIENSRNSWNDNGAPDLSQANQQAAGDRLYSDFLLTFDYNDQLLNGTTKVSKAGFVLEQVRELDMESEKYVTKSASVYQEEYTAKETAAMENAKAYIADPNKKSTDDHTTFVANSPVDLKGLDNKNQTKFSFNFKNKSYKDLEPGNAKKYVYRAYSYMIVDGNTVISRPVYFTIYDMASIEPIA